jgi:hypothetical protein
MADTGIDPANSRRGADAGWPVAHHRIGGANCRIRRNIVDVDLDRAGSVRKSVVAGRSLRRAGERSLPDRMRDHGVVTRAVPISDWIAHASSREIASPAPTDCVPRSRYFHLGDRVSSGASNDCALVLRYIESEFKYQPESKQLR